MRRDLLEILCRVMLECDRRPIAPGGGDALFIAIGRRLGFTDDYIGDLMVAALKAVEG